MQTAFGVNVWRDFCCTVPQKVSQQLQSYIEADVIENCSANPSLTNIDAELFGTFLVQYDIATETMVSGPMYAPDISPDERIGALFQIIQMRIKAEPSPKSARKVFNTVVTIIAEPLGCVDIAQALVAMCSKSQNLMNLEWVLIPSELFQYRKFVISWF